MNQTRRELVAIVGFALFAACAAAQNPAAPPKLAFEVASIKPAGPLDPMAMAQGKVRVGMTVDGAICNIGSLTLRDLIRIAYEVKDLQISGAEALGAPLEAQRFNIQATMPPGATQKEVPQMLQALLAERFALVVHRETKDQSVFALVVGKGGPKMKEAQPDAPPPAATDEPKKEAVAGQGGQVGFSGNIADGKGMTMRGGPMGQMHMTMVDGKMRMEAEKMTMPVLAEIATTFVGRPVMDMTELKGSYQVALDLSLSELMNVARNAGMPIPAGAPGGNTLGEASDPSGSSIFASVQQMGLKLEQRKAPLPFIVIDHVEKTPTEN